MLFASEVPLCTLKKLSSACLHMKPRAVQSIVISGIYLHMCTAGTSSIGWSIGKLVGNSLTVVWFRTNDNFLTQVWRFAFLCVSRYLKQNIFGFLVGQNLSRAGPNASKLLLPWWSTSKPVFEERQCRIIETNVHGWKNKNNCQSFGTVPNFSETAGRPRHKKTYSE